MKIEDLIIQSRLRWHGYVMRGDINSEIRESNSQIMRVKIIGKRKKARPRKSWDERVKKDLERSGLRREDVYNKKKCQ